MGRGRGDREGTGSRGRTERGRRRGGCPKQGKGWRWKPASRGWVGREKRGRGRHQRDSPRQPLAWSSQQGPWRGRGPRAHMGWERGPSAPLSPPCSGLWPSHPPSSLALGHRLLLSLQLDPHLPSLLPPNFPHPMSSPKPRSPRKQQTEETKRQKQRRRLPGHVVSACQGRDGGEAQGGQCVGGGPACVRLGAATWTALSPPSHHPALGPLARLPSSPRGSATAWGCPGEQSPSSPPGYASTEMENVKGTLLRSLTAKKTTPAPTSLLTQQ